MLSHRDDNNEPKLRAGRKSERRRDKFSVLYNGQCRSNSTQTNQC